jgi:eukaryotic-like serine/threonine-protein kinase
MKYMKYLSALFLCICLLPCISISPLFADNTDQAAWPIYRGNHQMTGVSETVLPDIPVLLWSYETGDAIHSSPVISGGMVFTGSDDGNLYALDQKTGKRRWSLQTDDAIEASPLYISSTHSKTGNLHTATLLYTGTLGGVFYAVDVSDGTVKWQFKADSQISGSANYAIIKEGKKACVAFGSYDNHLYCLDASTGKKLWSYEAESYINGAAALYNDSFIFGGCDAMIRVVRIRNGKELFHIDAGSYIPGTVAVDGHMAFAGHYGSKVVCIDLENRRIRWQFGDEDTGAPFFSSPAVGKGCVLIGSEDGVLYCIDQQTGKLKWEYTTGDTIKSSPVITGERVVFCSADGYIYLLDLQTGEKHWSWEIGAGITSSPALAGGMLVIGAEDGVVYAFGSKAE